MISLSGGAEYLFPLTHDPDICAFIYIYIYIFIIIFHDFSWIAPLTRNQTSNNWNPYTFISQPSLSYRDKNQWYQTCKCTNFSCGDSIFCQMRGDHWGHSVVGYEGDFIFIYLMRIFILYLDMTTKKSNRWRSPTNSNHGSDPIKHMDVIPSPYTKRNLRSLLEGMT